MTTTSMFRASSRFISSKPAVRHSSAAASAREWLKPLANAEPNARRQPAWNINQDRGRPYGEGASRDEVQVSRSSEGSRPPRYQHLAAEGFQPSKRTFQENHLSRGEGEVLGGSRPYNRHPGPDYSRRYERSSSLHERPQHRGSARTADEENRYSAPGYTKGRPYEVDERMETLQEAGFIKTRPHSRHPGQDYAKPMASKNHKRVREAPVIRPEDAITYFESNVSSWASHYGNIQRIVSYGLPEAQTRTLLKHFVKVVKAGTLSSDTVLYGLDRFGHLHEENSIEVIYSTIFFTWAAQIDTLPGVNPEVLLHIQRLVETTSRPFPSDEYRLARRLRRKVIMHVGPTNSGKTHHALRAFAAADTGVYAGPLRLLAHEIFHRLNSGSIVPLGVEQDPTTRAGPNPAHARVCNLVTGEERRVVSEDARHISCTVEMLSTDIAYDVAVVDEIQLIGDSERGAAWTQAVLGLPVKELHLCGEETAVPVVEALLAQTGDEIEVRRYNRLTALTVDDNVLDGDLSKIQKGDCIVTFSRSSIFALKKEVEKVTGMRCAVVYGRLPPETRNEQAALFNDPESGYDVIIGSDAIGMGLNLMIKRVIFSSTSKFDGKDDVPLQVSSVKQIAGRAGRFGMHKDGLGGSTTTMFKSDLPHLKYCIAQPYQPLAYGRIALSEDHIERLLSILPIAGSSIGQAMAAGQYIGRLPSFLRYSSPTHYDYASEYIHRHWSDMTIRDKISLLFVPIPWREARTVEMITPFLKQHKEQGNVTFFEAMEPTGLMRILENVEQMVAQGKIAPIAQVSLGSQAEVAAVTTFDGSNEAPLAPAVHIPASDGKPKLGPGLAQRRRMAAENMALLESFHKVVVVYMWWSIRIPIVYAEGAEVEQVKQRLEIAMNGLLTMMTSEGTVALKDIIVQGKMEKTANAVIDSDQQVAETLQVLG